MRSRHTLGPLAFAAFAAIPLLPDTVPAQSLDKRGGAVGGRVAFDLRGAPGEQYLVLLSLLEVPTPVPALGITLDVADSWAGQSLALPGFLGRLSAAGGAEAAIAVPADPALGGLRVPVQATFGTGPFQTSNLVRVTLQPRGTFVPALTAPVAPIAGGGVVALADGEFLFAGGSGSLAQRYRSRTEEWSGAGSAVGTGLFAQATGLPDGRVLFTGGADPVTGQATAAAWVYDPVTQQTATLQMGEPRAGHGASVLGNGRVLITGGMQSFSLSNPLSLFTGLTATTELFDPATDTFAPGPTMLEPRALHTQTTLTNGDALVAGGLSLLPIVSLPVVSSTAYRFNPNTGSFGLPALFPGGRFLHGAAALDDGKVLLAGGVSLDLSAFLLSGNWQDIVVTTRTDCQLFAAGAFGFGTFTTVNGMQEGRAGPAMAALPGGRALIAGGFQLTVDLVNQTLVTALTRTADVFAQGPAAIAPTGSMAAPRLLPLAVPLPDETVLLVGGGPLESEIYQH